MQGYIAVLASVGIAFHLIFRFFIPFVSAYDLYPLYFTLALGGGPLVIDLFKKMLAFEFGSDLLAGISIIRINLLRTVFGRVFSGADAFRRASH